MPYKNKEDRRRVVSAWKARNKDRVAAHERKHKEAYPERFEARDRVNHRVRHGYWPKPSFFACTDCGTRAAEYHHEDYSLWWSVLPLCKDCHVDRHARNPAA
jgi:hypothetical protein